MRRMTKKEIEDFQRRYEESKPVGPGRIPVRIVGGPEFESLEACAQYLRVSVATVSRIMNRSGEPYGDVQIERVS